jgi:hypothetical protein
LIWQDNIKADFLERRLGDVGSLEISQDQVQWLAFVNPSPLPPPLKTENITELY